MFGFGSKKAPTVCKTNPGFGIEVKLAFASGSRSWNEAANVLDVAAAAFKAKGMSVSRQKSWLEHAASGFLVSPQIVGVQPLEDGGVRTVTTMQINHPTLVPDGLFEYQHSAADNIAEAVHKGFDQWLQMDFATLLESQRPKPEACTTLQMEFPEKDDRPARVRRAVLGPIAHFMAKPPPAANPDEEHPFCPAA